MFGVFCCHCEVYLDNQTLVTSKLILLHAYITSSVHPLHHIKLKLNQCIASHHMSNSLQYIRLSQQFKIHGTFRHSHRGRSHSSGPGVDFLLAPYLSEPIGQSDVEMGFLGVPWKAEGETQGIWSGSCQNSWLFNSKWLEALIMKCVF